MSSVPSLVQTTADRRPGDLAPATGLRCDMHRFAKLGVIATCNRCGRSVRADYMLTIRGSACAGPTISTGCTLSSSTLARIGVRIRLAGVLCRTAGWHRVSVSRARRGDPPEGCTPDEILAGLARTGIPVPPWPSGFAESETRPAPPPWPGTSPRFRKNCSFTFTA